jgi:enamine deaminase RidA (YjgF/YER057c/UK114 family)
MRSALLAVLVFACPLGAQVRDARFINPPGLVKPNGYTHVVIGPDGRTVHVAGQIAFDSTGQLVGTGDFRRQAEQVMTNLRTALAAGGATFDDVVKTTTYMVDPANNAILREVRQQFIKGDRYPANTLVPVAMLARPGLLLEIEAVAMLREPRSRP